MPAYRSSAEGEIREAVVDRLRELIPGCRIIHEINAASFGNRIDVLAVGETEMAAVEIKSSKDKLDRLPDQIAAMRNVTNLVFAALHEKFLRKIGENVYPPDEARHALVWVYPRIERKGHVDCGEAWDSRDRWAKPVKCLPPGAVWMLWRDELQSLCRGIGVRGVSKLTMEECIDHMRWNLTGEQVTRAVCETLRRRQCVEADPAIAANDNADTQVSASLFTAPRISLCA